LILIDANVLLYAYDPGATQHPKCRAWLEEAFSGPQAALCWASVLAFLRIGTHPRVFERPFSRSEALAIVAAWRPRARMLEPGERYPDLLARMIEEGQASGPLVMDAALAALALEHGAALCTTDRDFARFPGLRLVSPLA
jgi:toxin-antitoxin system PIN domain toxin